MIYRSLSLDRVLQLVVLFLCVAISPSMLAAPAVELTLAKEGKALLPIVVPVDASEKIMELARDLAEGLKRVTGAEFEIQQQALAGEGILIGTEATFPNLLPVSEGEPIFEREDYLLKSDGKALYLIGRTDLAVQNAVWDFFYRIGFRQFFPAENWEIWPELPSLAVTLDSFERPDYRQRRFSKAASQSWDKDMSGIEKWEVRNRMVAGFQLQTGHSYGAFVHRNRDEFKAHPEYLTGEGENAKFDVSQPGLKELILRDVLKRLESGDITDCVSADPSDGGNWREDSPLGSPSDQALTLANYLAENIRKTHPDTRVGMYAYNQHSPAPTFRVDPNVIISVATAFMRGGYTIDEIIQGWQEKGAQIGIREYSSTGIWARAMPGAARASDMEYIRTMIPKYYAMGARYHTDEVSQAWGPYGLGHYLITRILWDVKEADRLPDLLQDFYSRSFGNAQQEMQAYYEQFLFKSANPLLSDDLIGRMYRQLAEALKKDLSAAETKRVEDFVLYSRFVELILAYKRADTTQQWDAYTDAARFGYRMRHSRMIDQNSATHYIPIRDLKRTREEVSALFDTFKDLLPPDTQEIRTIMTDGIARNEVSLVKPIAYSKNLVPYQERQGTGDSEDFGREVKLRGTNTIYLYAVKEKENFRFQARAGTIYADRGVAKFTLYSAESELVGTPIASKEIPPDKEIHEIEFTSPYRGLHMLEVSDGDDGTDLSWPVGQYASFSIAPEEGVSWVVGSPAEFVFYVAKGSEAISGYNSNSSGRVWIGDVSSKIVFDFKETKTPNNYEIPVPDAGQGTLWRMSGLSGKRGRTMLTTPPFVARNAAELLIPTETRR